MNLKNVFTTDLLEEISTRDIYEIRFCLTSLMINNRINFIDLLESYVKSLEYIRQDEEDKMTEATACVFESLMQDNFKDNICTRMSILRRLYLINQSGQYITGELNKKFSYNEEEAKKFSIYERNKKDSKLERMKKCEYLSQNKNIKSESKKLKHSMYECYKQNMKFYGKEILPYNKWMKEVKNKDLIQFGDIK